MRLQCNMCSVHNNILVGHIKRRTFDKWMNKLHYMLYTFGLFFFNIFLHLHLIAVTAQCWLYFTVKWKERKMKKKKNKNLLEISMKLQSMW